MTELNFKVTSMMFYDSTNEVVLVCEDDDGRQFYFTLEKVGKMVDSVFLTMGEVEPEELGFDVDNPPKKIEFSMDELPNPFEFLGISHEIKKSKRTFELSDHGETEVVVKYADSPDLEETFSAKYWTYEESEELGYFINVELANGELSASIDVYVPEEYFGVLKLKKEQANEISQE